MKAWIMAGVCVAMAGMTLAEEEAPGGFRHGLNLGLTLTAGNSDTLQANAVWLSEGQLNELGAVRAGLEGRYGETGTGAGREATMQNVRALANVKKTISPETFASLDATFLYDAIARVDYRAIVSPGAGLFLWRDERATLYLEVGPSYVWERVADEAEDYFAFRFAERLEVPLSRTSKLWQMLEYVPRAAQFADFLLNAEIGLEAAMTDRLHLRLLLQNRHDSRPGAELERNDLALITAVGVTL